MTWKDRTIVRRDGWGYGDTEFKVGDSGLITLTGSRYPFSGMVFPNLREWVESKLGLHIESPHSHPP